MKFKNSIIIFICTTIFAVSVPSVNAEAAISDYVSFVILSDSYVKMNIGDTYELSAITSTLKKPKWKSSDSKIATVNASGVIKAKKSGTVEITASIKNAASTCTVTIRDTSVKISYSNITLENKEDFKLFAVTSNNSAVKWKSSKTSIASVDKTGLVTARKPGETIITATADGTKCECLVTVKAPTISLSNSSLSLYRNQTCQLKATVSSASKAVWKSNKSSVATVNGLGLVTAKKNGTAIISVTVDGVKEECFVTVNKPVIILTKDEIHMLTGSVTSLKPSVSSGNTPTFKSSNTNIVTVDSTGTLRARKKGKATITVSEDGEKVKCTVYVTDK